MTTLCSYGLLAVGAYVLVGRVNPIPDLPLVPCTGLFMLTLLVASSMLWIPFNSILIYCVLAGVLMLLFGAFVSSLGWRMCLQPAYRDTRQRTG